MQIHKLSPLYFDDKELLKKVANGDERAFETVYHAYSKKIYLFAYRTLQSELAAEEVVQEVMLKLWNLGADLQKINNLEAYLRVLSRNISLNLLRRQAIEYRASQTLKAHWNEESNDTEERVSLNETRAILAKGIAQLPPQQREVYQLCHQQGLKYEEVARELKLSPTTVATHMKLALRFLRSYMQKHSDLAIICIIFKLF
jgi:RNA polymerase sigma-70 factor (ECF subfamily)